MLSAAVGSVCTAIKRRPWVRLKVARAAGGVGSGLVDFSSDSSDSVSTSAANRFTENDIQKDYALLPP